MSSEHGRDHRREGREDGPRRRGREGVVKSQVK